MSKQPWIRLYREALHDPKLVTLTDRQHRAWINCLLVASDTGALPSRRDIAVHMRMTMVDVEQLLCDLVEAELLDADSMNGPVTTYRIHGWSTRQYATDSSAERMRKHRAKRRDGHVTSQVTSHVTERDGIESDTDTDKESLGLPSSLEAAREKKKNDQGVLSNFRGRRQGGRHEKIVRRAEGLGAPVDELVAAVNQHKPKNRSAYFTALCVEWFRRRLPGIDEQIIRDALWGTDAQYAVVINLMVQAT
jgi:hypothetical protein